MASNNHHPDPTIFSGDSLNPRRRKHRKSAVAVAFRLRSVHKNNGSPVNFWERLFHKSEVSARKLAAGLWQLRFMEVSGDADADADADAAFRYASSFPSSISRIKSPRHRNSGEKFEEIKDQLRRQTILRSSRNRLRCKIESSMACLNCSKEESTKGNPGLNNDASKECVEDKKCVGGNDSVMTTLLEELLRAQRTINNLKAAKKSSKKKVEQFLQNLEKEKLIWKHREWQRMETMLGGLKDKLEMEKRSREKMELLNTKLIQELAKANLSIKQFMTKYKKEKKERELIEEVCNELAMQIREDKAMLEGLSEVEEERKMMQMADLWREERVQMKLVEAQSLLEDKYNQMVQLIGFLEDFLRTRGAELDTKELEDTQLIKQVESVNSERIVELSDDFSNLEELIKDNTQKGMNKPHSYPLATMHIQSLKEEMLNKNSMLYQLTPSGDYNIGLELTNSSETVDLIEDQKFSSTPQRGHTYSVNVDPDLGKAECDEKTCLESLRTRVNGVCFVSAEQLKRKASLASEQLSPCHNAGTTIASSTKSSQISKTSVEGSFKHSELLAPGNSTCSKNPHILRGMKGCTEWPRAIPKSNSKLTPNEIKIEKPKSPLLHICKLH
ncbi:hypothetical protein VNO77_01795 [Canavalia gladiata]|uniref:Uncharacterized protein n=1 Tax=Canavalia gladiata TaxID=3824 RepID=A0AAN9MRT7_CANGL